MPAHKLFLREIFPIMIEKDNPKLAWMDHWEWGTWMKTVLEEKSTFPGLHWD